MRNDIAVTKQNDLESAKNFTTIVYALQAASFFVGITFFIAVIINYVKLSDVCGTWLESHFRWQIRTFWFSILWAVVGTVLIFALVGYLVLLAAGVIRSAAHSCTDKRPKAPGPWNRRLRRASPNRSTPPRTSAEYEPPATMSGFRPANRC